MDEAEKTSENKEALPPLPFTYIRTDDPARAGYTVKRYKIGIGGEKAVLYTDQELLDRAISLKENSEWYYAKEWREQGLPLEQIDFTIGDRTVTIYNFNKGKQFTDEHLEKFSEVLQRLAEHFPQILEQLRWVLVYSKQHESGYGDEKNYPLNGSAWEPWKAFKLQPRGMELFPHRVTKASNFEGTLIHELSHLIDKYFYKEWQEKFDWQPVAWIGKEGWEVRKTPDADLRRFYNKKTGEMAPSGRIPMEPEQCVTKYARISESEDFCESVVAYFYDPELLKRVSPQKYEILKRHDAKKPISEVRVKRVPKDEIRLPEIKPETIYYYIKEPSD